MKKFLKIILTLVLCFIFCLCFVGCSNNIIYIGREKIMDNQFILLEEFSSECGLCYDKDTHIIYIYKWTDGVNYSPYYVMDTDNNPVIAVYNGDECDEEF